MEPTPTTNHYLPNKPAHSHTPLYIIIGVLVLGGAVAAYFYTRHARTGQPTLESQLQALEQSSQPVSTTPSQQAKELKGLEGKAVPSTADREAQLQALETN